MNCFACFIYFYFCFSLLYSWRCGTHVRSVVVRCRPIVVQQKRHKNQISNTAARHNFRSRKVKLKPSRGGVMERVLSELRASRQPRNTYCQSKLQSHQKAETKILWQKLSQRAANLSIVRAFMAAAMAMAVSKLFYSLDFVLQNSCQHLIWLRTRWRRQRITQQKGGGRERDGYGTPFFFGNHAVSLVQFYAAALSSSILHLKKNTTCLLERKTFPIIR